MFSLFLRSLFPAILILASPILWSQDGAQAPQHPLTIDLGVDIREVHNNVNTYTRGGEIKATVNTGSTDGLLDLRGSKTLAGEDHQIEFEAQANYSYFFLHKMLGVKLKNTFEHRSDEQFITQDSPTGLTTLISTGLFGVIQSGTMETDFNGREHGIGLTYQVFPDQEKKIKIDFSLIPTHSVHHTTYTITSGDFPPGTTSVENRVVEKDERMLVELILNATKLLPYFDFEVAGTYKPEFNQTSDYLAELKTTATIDFSGPFSLKLILDIDYDSKPELIRPKTNRTTSLLINHSSGWF